MNRGPVAGAVAGFAAMLAVLLVLVMLVRTWGLAESVRGSQQSNTRTLELIESCTTVGGECYQRSQKRTADVVGLLNNYQRRIVTLAAACADRPRAQTVEQIRQCVEQGLDTGD